MESNTNLITKLDQIENLPSLPSIVFDIITLIKSEPGNNYKLAKLIAKDQGVTTKLISVVNSPLYGFNQEVTSLELAIMLLGTKEIESIVTAISISDSLKVKSSQYFNYSEYWQHSMLVGLTARDLVRKFGFPEFSGEAFLGGILHDIGIQIIVKFFKDEFIKIIEETERGVKFIDAEKNILGLSHAEIGKYLSVKWNLPEGLKAMLEFHHAPSNSPHNQIIVSSIHLADYLTQEFKIGSVFWDNDYILDDAIQSILEFDSRDQFEQFTADYEDSIRDSFESAVM